jgi:AraC family transcriptional regulator
LSAERNFHGLEIELHRYPGVRVLRVVHPHQQSIGEHKHDWAYIGLHTLGAYRETFDGGEEEMAGPCAVLHPRGRPHADAIHEAGLETLTVEFDEDWLKLHGFDGRLDRSEAWAGGPAAIAGRQLARAVSSANAAERDIGRATTAFLRTALASETPQRPAWLDRLEVELTSPRPPSTTNLAKSADLHPAWLARAYRYAAGEGMHETVRRKRVERACTLLRQTEDGLPDIALAAGFCDQSHMNRNFRQVLGRTPLQVRGEQFVL